MKTRLFAIALVAMVIGFGSCGGKEKDKSKECDIKTFTVDGKTYTITGLDITYTYPKSGPDAWLTEPTWPVEPKIEISPKAKISPLASEKKTFVNANGTSADVKYTVTAEDGTTKTYTVKATKSMEYNP